MFNTKLSQSQISEVSKQANSLLCERSFHEFVKQAFNIIEPSNIFIDSRHIEFLCKNIEQVALDTYLSKDVVRNVLVINVPPRSMKSLLVNVFLPAWLWIRFQGLRIISASSNMDLSTQFSVTSRRLIESAWYKENWKIFLQDDSNQKTFYSNMHGGERFTTSVNSRILGHSGELIICDDINDIRDTDDKRKDIISWFNSELTTRSLTPGKSSLTIVIQQRLHEEDISGYLLNNTDCINIILPAHYESEHSQYTCNTIQDFRTEENQSLWGRGDTTDYNTLQKSLGSLVYAGMYQQSPAKLAGNLINRDWLNYYDILPTKFDSILQSWDIAIKDTKTSDYTACTVWGRIGSNYYLIDIYRDKLEFPALIKQFQLMQVKHQQAIKKLVEDKASGSPLIQSLRNSIPGIIPINPRGDKISRFSSVTPLFEAGNIYLPKSHKLLEVYIQELLTFPNSKHDDLVDTTSQALSNMTFCRNNKSFKTTSEGLY